MGRDSRTKRYAEQIDQDAATAYMPIIEGGVADNLLIVNADGEAEDSGTPLSDLDDFMPIVSGATVGNFAAFDAAGEVEDSGYDETSLTDNAFVFFLGRR
jgi:hypothetical protein